MLESVTLTEVCSSKLAMRGEPNICVVSEFQMEKGEEVLPCIWLVSEQSHRWGTS